MRTSIGFHHCAMIALCVAAGLIAAGCGGAPSAQEMEVTFYYLPG